MNDRVKEKIESLKKGDSIQVLTALKGQHRRDWPSGSEGFKTIKHAGKFIGILPKDVSDVTGPFVDDYLQIEVVGEKPVFNNFKLVGWKEGKKVQSIPFRNIKVVETL